MSDHEYLQRPEYFRFHIPAIPHTITNKTYVSCAYTQKVLKLCKMLTQAGHTVYHYGCEGSDVVATECVEVVSQDEQSMYYGDQDDFTQQYRFDQHDNYHQTFYQRTAQEIQCRLQPRDFVLCAWGYGHKPIVDKLQGECIVVESGIGYPDTWAPYRVFESYYWQGWCYGKEQRSNGAAYDTVIPNFFDPLDFTYTNEIHTEPYMLYLGRLVERKGVAIAAQACRQAGFKLVVAGQGLLPDVGLVENQYLQFVGFADQEKRRALLAGAQAVLCPTQYLEPFGGVAVEAMFSGTPVVASDWGAFTETVLPGITGYRCSTLDQFVSALHLTHLIDRGSCRKWAMENYSLGVVAGKYVDYFTSLYGLWGSGWSEVSADVGMNRGPFRFYP